MHGDASAVRCGAHARTASAGGAGNFAESDDRAREHGSGEQVLHLIFLLDLEAQHLLRTVKLAVVT